MVWSESEGELTTESPQMPGPLSSGGKKRGPARTSPVQYTQFSAKADWIPATIGPVTRVMLSRHSWEFRTFPFHFLLTAAPPVNPILPSITVALRCSRRYTRTRFRMPKARKRWTLTPARSRSSR